ncbi:hypothetical protein EVAR_7845_1 [Eumeta japonica]|uniref:Uncharacterized protein n=1 Tax=Eumeta variegata TaxID=151549 RepID=A0A4C1TUZ8_EUMVA|nr:hypothetical protein EVAR_7845_1 [Eumeta japonica]
MEKAIVGRRISIYNRLGRGSAGGGAGVGRAAISAGGGRGAGGLPREIGNPREQDADRRGRRPADGGCCAYILMRGCRWAGAARAGGPVVIATRDAAASPAVLQ